MRTYDEIVERCRNPKSMFGFDINVLISYLDFDRAKEFLNDDVTKETWETIEEDGMKIPFVLDRDTVTGEIDHYMEFALGKAVGHRGLSAGRSIEKFEAWIWLLGDEPINAEYPNYGAPILKAICERYEINWRNMLNLDEFEMFERMAEGKPCRDECNEGCGYGG